MKAIQQEAILEAKRLELSRQIASTYYELGFVASGQKINQLLINMLTQLLRVSETRYAAGQGLQQDVLQAQVEVSKLLDEQITLDKKRRMLEDRINSLLNRESFIPVTPPETLKYLDTVLEEKKLQTLALTMNFGVQADAETLRRQRATEKARAIVDSVQASSGLEGQAVGEADLQRMTERTVNDLLSGPKTQLWRD